MLYSDAKLGCFFNAIILFTFLNNYFITSLLTYSKTYLSIDMLISFNSIESYDLILPKRLDYFLAKF